MEDLLSVLDERIRGGVQPEVVLLSVDSLLPNQQYPRLDGVDADHARVLAEVHQSTPPILVQRSMHVIDGMHRLEAARLNGARAIQAIVLDEADDEAFLLSLRANIGYGLPLTLRDRKAAAEQILRRYPEKSDRAVALLAGLTNKTGGVMRRASQLISEVSFRVGSDGRTRPTDGVDRRNLACQIIAARPGASLREVAAIAGVSPGTVRRDRQQLARGDAPVATRPRRRLNRSDDLGEPGGAPDPREVLSNLVRDPSLRYSDVGRALLRLLHQHPAVAPDQPDETLISAAPPHCLPVIARLSRRYALYWQELAQRAEEQADPATPRFDVHP